MPYGWEGAAGGRCVQTWRRRLNRGRGWWRRHSRGAGLVVLRLHAADHTTGVTARVPTPHRRRGREVTPCCCGRRGRRGLPIPTPVSGCGAAAGGTPRGSTSGPGRCNDQLHLVAPVPGGGLPTDGGHSWRRAGGGGGPGGTGGPTCALLGLLGLLLLPPTPAARPNGAALLSPATTRAWRRLVLDQRGLRGRPL